MREDATKIYLNKESAPCSRRQKAVCFKQTGQRPAQREKARGYMTTAMVGFFKDHGVEGL